VRATTDRRAGPVRRGAPQLERGTRRAASAGRSLRTTGPKAGGWSPSTQTAQAADELAGAVDASKLSFQTGWLLGGVARATSRSCGQVDAPAACRRLGHDSSGVADEFRFDADQTRSERGVSPSRLDPTPARPNRERDSGGSSSCAGALFELARVHHSVRLMAGQQVWRDEQVSACGSCEVRRQGDEPFLGGRSPVPQGPDGERQFQPSVSRPPPERMEALASRWLKGHRVALVGEQEPRSAGRPAPATGSTRGLRPCRSKSSAAISAVPVPWSEATLRDYACPVPTPD